MWQLFQNYINSTDNWQLTTGNCAFVSLDEFLVGFLEKSDPHSCHQLRGELLGLKIGLIETLENIYTQHTNVAILCYLR